MAGVRACVHAGAVIVVDADVESAAPHGHVPFGERRIGRAAMVALQADVAVLVSSHGLEAYGHKLGFG